MTRLDFAELVDSQPWELVDLQYDGWYQYSIRQKREAADVRTEVA